MNVATIIFILVAAVSVLTATGMLVSRSTIYSALLLVLNFASVAFLYFMLGAPFIALAQITVYAGAIMVLFLFVIMLLGPEKGKTAEPTGWTKVLGGITALVVLGEAVYMIFAKNAVTAGITVPEVNTATTKAIGLLLFDQYTLPFEITSFILLVAVIGAVVLTKPDKKKPAEREVK